MEGEIEYGLQVPFVNVQSMGGKFDDESFVAGYQMGLLDFRLFQANAIVTENLFAVIRADNEQQADLIAMKHKYHIEEKTVDESGEWVTCLFVRNQDVSDL